jgi:hypothetical protein
MTAPTGIDPRGPRFGASITALLLLVVVFLALLAEPVSVSNSATGVTVSQLSLESPLERLLTPSALLFSALVALFAWGALAGIQRHPYGLLFRALVRPRLGPPTELESPVPPTFAQGVGFTITAIGLVLHILGVPYALVIAASAAFIAAFLNAVFAYCLGCQIYLALTRAGILGRKGASAA